MSVNDVYEPGLSAELEKVSAAQQSTSKVAGSLGPLGAAGTVASNIYQDFKAGLGFATITDNQGAVSNTADEFHGLLARAKVQFDDAGYAAWVADCESLITQITGIQASAAADNSQTPSLLLAAVAVTEGAANPSDPRNAGNPIPAATGFLAWLLLHWKGVAIGTAAVVGVGVVVLLVHDTKTLVRG